MIVHKWSPCNVRTQSQHCYWLKNSRLAALHRYHFLSCTETIQGCWIAYTVFPCAYFSWVADTRPDTMLTHAQIHLATLQWSYASSMCVPAAMTLSHSGQHTCSKILSWSRPWARPWRKETAMNCNLHGLGFQLKKSIVIRYLNRVRGKQRASPSLAWKEACIKLLLATVVQRRKIASIPGNVPLKEHSSL